MLNTLLAVPYEMNFSFKSTKKKKSVPFWFVTTGRKDKLSHFNSVCYSAVHLKYL